jgi:transcriptional regulator GlxA family with amidase domain
MTSTPTVRKNAIVSLDKTWGIANSNMLEKLLLDMASFPAIVPLRAQDAKKDKNGMGSCLDEISDWEALARENNFRVSRLAQSTGVCQRQLERYFHHKFQLSPRNWLEKLKMADAESLRRQGLPVKEIASITGFKNPTHFSRAHRRHQERTSFGTSSEHLKQANQECRI